MFSNCPSCKTDIDIKKFGDPFTSDIYCNACERYHHYIYCDHCNDILCLSNRRKECDLPHEHNLKYRNCKKCNKWMIFKVADDNNELHCFCGNIIEKPLETKKETPIRSAKPDEPNAKDLFKNMFGYDETSLFGFFPGSDANLFKFPNTEMKINKIYPIERKYKTKNKVHSGKIYVTLEDVYRGCNKNYLFKDKTFDIEIKPGFKDGTKFTFENQTIGCIDKYFMDVYDIILTLTYIDHKDFTRVGDNVIYQCDISNMNPNKKYKITFTHLNGEPLSFVIDKTLFDVKTFLLLDKGFENHKQKEKGHMIVKLITH